MNKILQKNERRIHKIAVYLTDEEKVKAEEYANSERLKLSSLVRKMILDRAYKKEKEKNEC